MSLDVDLLAASHEGDVAGHSVVADVALRGLVYLLNSCVCECHQQLGPAGMREIIARGEIVRGVRGAFDGAVGSLRRP